MPEKISQKTRSRMMAGIRGRDTKPEHQVRKHLHAAGYRFRLFRKDLPGRPDVVLPKWDVVIFVHGCFWHGHKGCRYFRLPKTRTGFWKTKIDGNSKRDAIAVDRLRGAGWRVAIIWECALRDDPDRTLDDLIQFIRSERSFLEVISHKPDHFNA